jgi:hypothetical protein
MTYPHARSGIGTSRDKNGRAFKRGDIVKIFHFIGKRRKRHYMYKQVVKGDPKYLWFSHLDQHGDKYPEPKDGGVFEHYEIVQGWDDFEARPKLITPA